MIIGECLWGQKHSFWCRVFSTKQSRLRNEITIHSQLLISLAISTLIGIREMLLTLRMYFCPKIVRNKTAECCGKLGVGGKRGRGRGIQLSLYKHSTVEHDLEIIHSLETSTRWITHLDLARENWVISAA